MSHQKKYIKDIRWSFLVGLLIIIGGVFLFVNHPALAAQTPAPDAFGLEQTGAATGLGSTDIRLTVARIINVALSLLGVVALVLILYGGYRYMTAAGNEENIAQAKRIITNAAIGLAIILSAFAITQFVLRQLGSATGFIGFGSDCTNVAFANANRDQCGEPGGPGGGRFSCSGNTGGPFVVRSITPVTPIGQLGMNNIAVRVIFSQRLDGTIAADSAFTISRGGTDVSRDFTYQFVDGERSIVEARLPTNQAAAPDGLYEVRVGAVRAAGGAELITGQTACGTFRGDATFRIQAGALPNTTVPNIRNITFNGLTFGGVVALPRGRSHLLAAELRDDQGIGYVRLEVIPPPGEPGNRLIIYDGPPVARGSWSTEGNPYIFQYPLLVAGNTAPNETYTVRLTAFDLDHNQIVQEIQFRVVGENCEFGTGAGEGAACRGNVTCQNNGDCVSGSCDTATGQCRAVPIISNVSPWESAGGTWVTILGQFFGNEPGRVEFGRNVAIDTDPNNDIWVPAVLAQCGAEDVWQDGFIIVEVPRDDSALLDGSDTIVRVTRAGTGPNLIDTTTDDRGPRPGPRQGLFRKDNNLTRPGLCRVVVDEGANAGVATAAAPNTAVRATGQGLTNTPGQIFFGGIQGEVRSWTPTAVQSRLPRNFAPGLVAVTVRVGTNESNGVPFRVLATGEEQTPPLITTVVPGEVTRESFVTITGERLGAQTGRVFFAPPGTDTCPGPSCVAAVIPEACGATGWQDTQVVVAAPRALALGAYRIILQDGQGRSARPSPDVIRVIDGPPRPGICSLIPASGPAPLPTNSPGLTITGANLGRNAELDNIRVLFFTRGAQTADLDPNRRTWLATQAADITVDTPNQVLRTRIPVRADGFSAQTGEVVVAVGANNFSNPVRYTVLNCNEPNAQIPAGFQCCVEQGRGVVRRNDFVCEGQIREAAYVWRFTTGRVPVLPQVAVACDQANWNVQGRTIPFPSPTPSIEWQQGRSACLNSSIAVRFTTDMDLPAAPVNGTPARLVRLFRCAEGERGQPDCAGANRTEITAEAALRYQNRVLLIRQTPPAQDLQPNTWYHVELLTNLQSLQTIRQNGADVQRRTPLLVTRPCGPDTAFCFDFKTGDNQTRCELAAAGIQPETHVTNRLGPLLSTAYPASANIPFYYYLFGRGNQVCSVLPVDGLGWNWRLPAPPAQTAARQQSATVTLAPTEGYTDTRATGQALQDNAPEGALIEAQNTPNAQTANQLTARTTLTIDLGTPRVINHWPRCSEACINATLGLEFNRPMDPSTYEGGFRLFRCESEARCNAADIDRAANAVPVTVQVEVSNRLTLRVLPRAGALIANTWYWAEATDQIRSVGQVDEAGNILRQGPPLEPSRWRFRTKADNAFCTADQVRIEPDPFTAYLINERTRYAAAPFTRPDACSVRGQELNPWQYGWRWQSENANVAVISTLALGGTGQPQPGCTTQCLPAGSDIVRDAVTTPICGNRLIDPGEDCEITGNNNTFQEVAGVSCSFNCLRPGNLNAGVGANQCGNGTIEAQFGEECDQPNRAICTERCTWAGSAAAFDSANPEAGFCENNGRGQVTPGEDCEIGVTNPGVGAGETAATCAENCLRRGTRLSQSWCDQNRAGLNEAGRAACRAAVSVCGNGAVETGEACEIINNQVAVYNGDNPVQPIATNAPRAWCNEQCLLQNICNTNVPDTGVNRLRCNPQTHEGCNQDCTLRGASVSLYNTPSLCGDGRLANQPAGIGEYAWCEPVNPAAPNPNRQNPVQLARAVGRGPVDLATGAQSTNIRATLTSIIAQTADLNPAAQVTGQGQYRLQCGYTEFAEPRQVNGVTRFNDCPNAADGVATDSCCYPRSRRSASLPTDGQGLPFQTGPLGERVCRNAALRVTFNGQIDETTLRNNIILARGYARDECAAVGGVNVTNLIRPTILAYLDNDAAAPADATVPFWDKIWDSLRRLARQLLGAVVHASRFRAEGINFWCASPIVIKPEVSYVYGGADPEVATETTVLLPIDRLLDADATYALFLRSGLSGIKDTRGLGILSPDPGQVRRDDSLLFRTQAGDGVCRIASLSVEPAQYLYSRANATNNFVASAISTAGQLIAPIPNVYDWRWSWGPTGDPLFTVPAPAVGNASANPADRAIIAIGSTALQGTKVATVNATITADVGNPLGAVFTGATRLRSLFCENPWPPRQWYPFEDGVPFGQTVNNDGVNAAGVFNGSVLPAANSVYFNFRTSYCADAGKINDQTDDLPYLRPIILNDIAPVGTLKRFLFFNEKNDDAIGIQVIANSERFSLADWYRRNFGEPVGFRALRLGGYEALSDSAGNNLYVNALNQGRPGAAGGLGEVFNNVYILSLNANAQDNTRAVFKRLIDALEFNINLSDVGYCLAGNVPITNLPPDPGALAIANVPCQSDFDCRDESGNPLVLPSPTNGICSAAKTKFLRDWQRLNSIRAAQTRLSTAAPELRSGTYIPRQSLSRWPSWGSLNIEKDPLNRWTSCGVCQNRNAAGQVVGCTRAAECVTGEGDRCVLAEAQTCWDAANGRFICPRAQSIFAYEKTSLPEGYLLRAPLEYFAPNSTVVTQFVNLATFTTTPICTAQTVQSPFSQTCGDGVINPATEQCDPPGRTELSNRRDANNLCSVGEQSVATCSPTCQWAYSACARQGNCGNSRVEQGEVCDDGPRNGTYGSCNANCNGLQDQRCGDGRVDPVNEVCDTVGLITGFCLNARGGSAADYGRSWVRQLPGSALSSRINSVLALDARTVWIAGGNRLLRVTRNTGTSWQEAAVSAAVPDDTNFLDIFFIDSQNGWVVGSNQTILRTRDGGANWNVQTTPLPLEENNARRRFTFNAVHFVNTNVGWVVGSRTSNSPNGALLATTDGGQTWRVQPTNASTLNQFFDVYFVDEQRGFVVGGNEGENNNPSNSVILRTPDGGRSWVRDQRAGGPFLSKIDFVGRDTGWIAGVDETLLKTEDGGVNWNQLSSRFVQANGDSAAIRDWRVVDFLDAQIGFIADDRGGISKSVNGGQAFTRQATPTTQSLTALSLVDSTAGWAAVADGSLLKTGVVTCSQNQGCDDGDSTPDTCAAADAPDYHPEQINSCALDCQRRGGYCGDGIAQGQFEQCDDGNRTDTDGCTNTCLERAPAPGQTLAVSGACGNDVIDAGEACDRGVFNGLACTPAYNRSCTYCARDCRSVLTVDPTSFCGNGALDPVARNAQGQPTGYEACEAVDDQILYYGPNQTSQTRLSNFCGVGEINLAQNFYTVPVGVYQCLNNCQNYTNTCTACGHKNIAQGGAVPRLAVLNVINTPSVTSDWGRATSVSLRFRPSVDQSPLRTTAVMRRTLGDSHTAMQSLTTNFTPTGRGIESRPVCDGLYALKFNQPATGTNETAGDNFPYPVAGEGANVDNEIAVSPAVPPEMIRVVVRWTERESNRDTVFFGGGIYNQSFANTAFNWLFCPIVNGQRRCSPPTYASVLGSQNAPTPVPGMTICDQSSLYPAAAGRYANYWLPSLCYAADHTGDIVASGSNSPTVQNGGIWFHRRINLPRTFVQATTIDTARFRAGDRAGESRPFAFFVEAIGQAGAAPIFNYRNSALTVEVYDSRAGQVANESIYLPARVFPITAAAGTSSNPTARYWHVFNLVFDTTTNQWVVRPVQRIQSGFQDIINELILGGGTAGAAPSRVCTAQDWNCPAFPTTCPLAGQRTRVCTLTNQTCTDSTNVRPPLQETCQPDCRSTNLTACTTAADCQSAGAGGVFNNNVCIAQNSVGAGGVCTVNNACVAGTQCANGVCRAPCTAAAWGNCGEWGVCSAQGEQTRTCQVVDTNCVNPDAARAQAERQVCTPRPDLRVETITGPATGVQGQNLSYTASVCNRGTANVGTTGTVPVRARYLIRDAEELQARALQIPVVDLNVGACVTTRGADFTNLPVGNARVEFTVDPTNPPNPPGQVPESNENNNTANQAVVITGAPNLVVEAITADREPIIQGDEVSFRVRIANTGTADVTTPFSVRVIATQGNQPILRNIDVPNLGSRSTREVTLPSLPIQNAVGTVTAEARVDSASQINEGSIANENDNTLTEEFRVLGLPDLVWGAVPAPAAVFVNDPINIQASVCNRGGSAITNQTIVVRMQATLPNGAVIDNNLTNLTNLQPNQCQPVSTSITSSVSGQVRVALQIDPNGAIREANENNNQTEFTVQVNARPDLVLEAIDGPRTAVLGDTLTYQVRVRNPSPVEAGSFVVRATFRLANGTSRQDQRTVGVLEANSATTVAVSTGSNFVVSGASLSVLVEVDPNNQVIESIEGANNVQTITVTITGPDLVFDNRAGVAPVVRRPDGQFQANICNNGTVQAGRFEVQFDTGGGNSGTVRAGPIAQNVCVSVLSGSGWVPNRPMTVTLDSVRTILELNENNNQFTLPR